MQQPPLAAERERKRRWQNKPVANNKRILVKMITRLKSSVVLRNKRFIRDEN